jgi:hypothetical protein
MGRPGAKRAKTKCGNKRRRSHLSRHCNSSPVSGLTRFQTRPNGCVK